MKNYQRTLCLLAMVAGGLSTAWAETVPPVEPPVELPVFEGTHDVNTINLFVSVLDGDRKPVSGLTIDDFLVTEDGEEREITNFSAVERAEGATGTMVTLETESSATEGSVAGDTQPDSQKQYVAILMDTASLQGRNQRRVLKGLEEFVRESTGRDDQVLIAANTGKLEILHHFSGYEAAILASLGRVSDLPTRGESSKAAKRYLKRTIFRTDLFKVRRSLATTGFDIDYSRAQAQMLITQISTLRWEEHRRIRQSIEVARDLLQSMAGLPGRKVVLWVGEDLAMRPAIDLYTAFYRKAIMLDKFLNLSRPSVWGQELDLRADFQSLAAVSQASNASIYIIDASDRDREVSGVDYAPPSVDSIVANEAGGEPWSPGIDFAEIRSLTEGSEYVALASGGSSYNAGRNVTAAVSNIGSQLATYYSIAYQRPGPPDGQQHTVKVKARGGHFRVHHHEKVIDRTAPQRLIDLTMSRLRLDAGNNPLGLQVALGEQEPADDERIIQTVQLALPLENLVLLPASDDRYQGRILVVVVVIDADGHTAAPQLLRLSLNLRSEQLAPDAVAQQSIRLLMKPGTQRLAVGVRDEVSGVEASNAIEFESDEI